MADTTYSYQISGDGLSNGTDTGTFSGSFTADYDTLRANGTITVTTPQGSETINIVNANISNGPGDPNQFTVSGTSTDGSQMSLTYSTQTPTTFDFGDYQYAGPGAANVAEYQVNASAPVSSTNTTTCFVSGTAIRTRRGDVSVELLNLEDVAIAASGEARPVRWLGHRTIACRNHPRPDEVMPIRISAHALGENRPLRDLFVSPGHSICVDVLGEVLIPAGLLVNGSTIQQVMVDEVTYWHVELESHDIIFAENLPAESYLDMGNRGFFKEADVIDLAASPDPARRTHADFCRPFVDGGPILEAVKLQLCLRAESAGWVRNDELEMHLVVDGRRFDPVIRDLTARFNVPADAKDVWLVSPTARPRDTLGGTDTRDLGLYIGGLRIDDGFTTRDVAIDDPLLCIGFHGVEDGARRWTSGRAKLPAALWEGCENDFYLRVELAGNPLPRWVAPAAKTVSAELPRHSIVA